jgi:ubiquinol-cytochrome c reductase iron-sulfur subunit
MSQDSIDAGRRRFLTTATTVIGGIGAAYVAVPFLASLRPSAKAEAAGAPVQVDISKLAEGEQLTVEWRGKPVWIVRRSSQMIGELPKLDKDLRDPKSLVDQQPVYAKNEYRSIKAEYFVAVGICTHLGCVPTYKPQPGSVDATWAGGFFCPCHGSKFDMAGRVYKGVPAPTNLVVPPYKYVSDTLILVGVDQEGAAA